MIKIINKIFARKKRQPNNDNCKRLYNLETELIKKLKNQKKSTMLIILSNMLR